MTIGDNTPDAEKRVTSACLDPAIDYFLRRASARVFDGFSHGSAIDDGLKLSQADIVCIIDSDCFIINRNIHEYIYQKFEAGYKAVGTEFNDGQGTKTWVEKNPSAFENIPVCFCAYYERSLAISQTWVITEQEVIENRSSGYIETGYRIRKYLYENNIATENWKTDAASYGECWFKNDSGETMCLHYVGGSHRRWNHGTKRELRDLLFPSHPLNGPLPTNRKVFIRIKGGLGNQLFQYAFSLHLKRHGIIVDGFWIESSKENCGRPYLLDSVLISAPNTVSELPADTVIVRSESQEAIIEFMNLHPETSLLLDVTCLGFSDQF